MKKILLILILLFVMTGCTDLNNTPKKQTEIFLNKYQTLDKDVLKDLDKVVAEETTFNASERDKYRDLMKKHYQSLTYEIKDSKENGDKATVTVEINVIDYSKTIAKTNTYLVTNKKEFLDDKGEYDVFKFNDYRIKELEQVKDKVKYTLDLLLTKKDKKWEIEPITSEIEDKIHGIYSY
ncbi:MAG: hypothetical protein RR404_03460 [Bacilli bacterium]